MRWLVWSIAGVWMELDGGQTFTHWAATRDGLGFTTIIGLLLGAVTHLLGQRFGCWGWDRC